MTAKRFRTNEVGCIVDYDDNLKNYDGEEIVNLLNKLAEENEQLKKILGFLKNDNANDIVEVLNLQQTEIWKVKRENEQLKQSINQLKIQNSRFMQEVAEYSRKSKELEKENEQLKSDYSEQCNQLDFLKDENAHMKNVLEENRQLKQFRQSVLDLIDKKLTEYPYLTLTEKMPKDCEHKHSCRENHEQNVAYASKHNLLQELKKELQE